MFFDILRAIQVSMTTRRRRNRRIPPVLSDAISSVHDDTNLDTHMEWVVLVSINTAVSLDWVVWKAKCYHNL